MEKKHKQRRSPRGGATTAHKFLSRRDKDGMDGTDKIRFSEQLWTQNQELIQQVLKTNFFTGVGNGTLDPVAFGSYVVQDAVYCYRAKKGLDKVAARSYGNLRNFFKHESKSYKSYFQDMFTTWNIHNPEGIALGSACQFYSDFEWEVACNQDPIYYIVGMIPCGRLWPYLGEKLKEQGANPGPYKSWIEDNFTGSGYQRLQDMVDEAYDKGKIENTLAQKIYGECMRGELDFFASVDPDDHD